MFLLACVCAYLFVIDVGDVRGYPRVWKTLIKKKPVIEVKINHWTNLCSEGQILHSTSHSYGIELLDYELIWSLLQCFEGSRVSELDVHKESVPGLCQLGLREVCPYVHKLTLSSRSWTATADLIKTACSSFHHLTELHVGDCVYNPSIPDPVPFCDAVTSSCPRLVKLSFSYMGLHNHVAAEILSGMKAHSSLKSIE